MSNANRLVIPIVSPHQEVDQRMAPHGVLRYLRNGRFIRAGGVESAPGWAAVGPVYQDDTDASLGEYTTSAIAIVSTPSPRIVGKDGVFRQDTQANRLIPIGDFAALAAPRSVIVGGARHMPLGTAVVGQQAFVVSQDTENLTVWITRLDKVGANWLTSEIYPFDTSGEIGTFARGAVSIVPGTAVAYGFADVGLYRRSLITKEAEVVIVNGGMNLALSAKALITSSGDEMVLTEGAGEGAPGTLVCIARPNLSTYQVVALFDDMDDSGAFRRCAWDACIAYSSDGTEALFVAYRQETPAGEWQIRMFNLADLLDGTATLVGDSGDTYEDGGHTMAIGPRLDADSGVYVFRSGVPPKDISDVDVYDQNVSVFECDDYGSSVVRWDTRRLVPDVAYTYFDSLEPICGWTTEGDVSRIVLGNYESPLFDRCYVVSVRSIEGSDNHRACMVDAVFGEGSFARPYDSSNFPSWIPNGFHGQVCGVPDEGGLLVAVPMLASTSRPGDIYPDQIGFFSFVESSEESMDDCVGTAINVAGAALVAGGSVTGATERCAFDYGMSHGAPGLVELEGYSTGTLSAEYDYTIVWEWTDNAGMKHIAGPSKVYHASLTDVEHVRFRIKRHRFPSGMRDVIARVYRTANAGLTFHEIAPSRLLEGELWDQLPMGVMVGDAGEDLYDRTTDADLELNPILYTQGATGALGGQLGYCPPPPCRHIAKSPTRVACSGLENVRMVHWSHEFAPGEPVQWSLFDAFRLQFPEEVIATAWNSSMWVVFGATTVWGVTGEGPDASGVGTFGQPYAMSAPVSAKSALAVASTSIGVVYQGTDGGIYVVQPGATSSGKLGAGERDTLAELGEAGNSVVSIVELVRDGIVCLIFHTNHGRLVFDVEHQAWSEETVTGAGRAVDAGGELVWVGRDLEDRHVCHEDAPGARPSWGEPAHFQIGMARLFPFGQDNFGRVRKIGLLGSMYPGDGTLSVFDEDADRTVSFTPAELGDGSGWDDSLDWAPPLQKRDSFLMSIDAASAPWRFHAVSIAGDQIPGGNRRRAPTQGAVDAIPVRVFDDSFDWTFE